MLRIICRLFCRKIFVVIALLGGIVSVSAFAADSGLSLSEIQSNLGKTVSQVAIILQDISLIAGIGFVMASFFKFHQHKLNPTQVPISQGITLLLIGAGLMLFPLLLPTTAKAAFGTGAKISKTTGSAITSIISGG